MRLTVRARLTLIASLVSLALAAPAPALAHDVRVSGHCGRGASSQLRLSAHDGAIRVEFELRGRRGGERWRVVLVHERRVRWRGRARTRSGSHSFRVRRSVPDFSGADQVTVRASGPRGNTCVAGGRLTGS
jgi:hypothetical protein